MHTHALACGSMNRKSKQVHGSLCVVEWSLVKRDKPAGMVCGGS